MKPADLLTPLSPLYGAVVRARAVAYLKGLLRRRRCELPVISIGNLTFGGTGKTPTVMALADDLIARGRRPAVLTRGHGRRTTDPLVVIGPDIEVGVDDTGDEPMEMARRLSGVPIVIDADRVRGCRAARELGADVVLLDDGFQHLRLERDFDLVLLDAGDPWGGGRLPPRGRLREPVTALGRASAVLITKIPADVQVLPEAIVGRIEAIAPGISVFGARMTPRRVWTGDSWAGPDVLRGRRVLAVAGLGRPEGFARMLETAGADVVGCRWFPDHHPFDASDRDRLLRDAAELDAVCVTTPKDSVKLEPLEGLWVVEAAMESLDGNWDALWATATGVI